MGTPSGLKLSVTASATDKDGILGYQWHFGDFGRAYTANASHTYTLPGTYQVICYVTDAIGNTSNQSFTVNITNTITSTLAPFENALFIANPNPATNYIKVEFKSSVNVVQVEIADMLGKNVYESIVNQENSSLKINIEHLLSGVYFLKIKTEDGDKLQRFIKE